MKAPVPSRLCLIINLPPYTFFFFSPATAGRPHSGHISPVSSGPFNSAPSNISAPTQSLYFQARCLNLSLFLIFLSFLFLLKTDRKNLSKFFHIRARLEKFHPVRLP